MHIKIDGSLMTVTSDLTNADLGLLKKHAPKSLILYERDEAGKSSPIFAMASGAVAAFTNNGVMFPAGEGGDAACAAIPLDGGMTKAENEAYVKENFGRGILRLRAVETQAKEALCAVKDDFDAAMGLVEVV